MFFRLLPVVALLSASVGSQAATPANAAHTAQNPNSVTITLSRQSSLSADTENSIQLDYGQPVRLEQVLRDSQQQLAQLDRTTTSETASAPRNYWLASAIYTPAADPTIAQRKESVLRQIDSLIAASEDPQSQAGLTAMKQWVATLTTQKKRLSGLDLDTTSIDPQHNPLVRDDIQLVVPQRPDWVQLVGAFTIPQSNIPQKTTGGTMGWGQIHWQPRTDANGYLSNIALAPNHAASEVWVIQPNGDTAKHPIAYWNASHHDIAPGAVIFIPFDTLPDAAASLNDDLLVLLQNSALQ